MSKHWMIFNPAINPCTFVFFFWKGDAATTTSWSVRDYSTPARVKLRRPRDFPPGLTPASILSSAVHKVPVTEHDGDDCSYWSKQTQQLNDQYLRQAPEGTLASDVGNVPPEHTPRPPMPVAASSYRPATNVLPPFFVPTAGIDDWRRFLADPDKHWRDNYSAKLTAESWEAAGGFPSSVEAALSRSPVFSGIEFLCGFPEYKVALPGGERASQNDILVLARTLDSLVSIAVEGKVDEHFDRILIDWAAAASNGKVVRLRFLLDTLGLPDTIPGTIRYQLLHRTASAVITARRFHARHAMLLVHSFSPADAHFEDYAAFLGLYGQNAKVGQVVTLAQLGDLSLHACWVRG